MLALEAAAQTNLQHALSFQEKFWKDKARINWLLHGDRNTSYFHKVAKIRAATKLISVLKHEDSIMIEATNIEQHVLQLYSNMYASNNVCSPNNLISKVIPKLVSLEDNGLLTSLPSSL